MSLIRSVVNNGRCFLWARLYNSVGRVCDRDRLYNSVRSVCDCEALLRQSLPDHTEDSPIDMPRQNMIETSREGN